MCWVKRVTTLALRQCCEQGVSPSADIADAGLSPVLGILNGVQDEMSTAVAGEKDSFAVAATSLAVAEDELARSSAGTDSAVEESGGKPRACRGTTSRVALTIGAWGGSGSLAFSPW